MDFEKLIYVVVGAILGFSLSLAKDWFMESKKQKEKEKQFKREKLEKAFMLLTDFDLKIRNLDDILFTEGKYNSFELNMIIRFYFENIGVEYSKYLNIAMKYKDDVKNGNKSENKLQDYNNEYKIMVNLLVKESKEL